MRANLTSVLLIVSLLQVSASSFAQKVNLSLKNAPLKEVMNQIRTQTGYDFVFNSGVLKEARPVSIDAKNAELEEVLKLVFTNQPLKYKINNHLVVVTIKEKPTFLERLAERWASIDVHGRVIDKDGNAIPGATVSVKGKSKSAITDQNGAFYIADVDENAVLVITYVGYATKEVAAAATTMGSITLVIATSDLQEVTINKGYYSTKQELNTGSLSSIKAADISKQPVSDPLLALQGKIPGLYLFQNSGVPGGGLTVRLRGRNSIANGNDPFYIVDGVPFNSNNLSQNTNATKSNLSPFMSIRPEDIESIDVLKDADATAIYGSRGANGVILITTKKGKAGQTKVDLNVSQGIGEVSKFFKLMNTQEYLEMRKEGYKNDGLQFPIPPFTSLNADLLVFDQNKYTDWQKKLIGGTADFTNAQISISGGSDQTQFLLSGSYRRETTVFPGTFNNQIGSALASINHASLNGKFKLNFSANYSNSNNRLPIEDMTKYIYTAPNAPDPYDNNGLLNWGGGYFNNPFAVLEQKLNANTANLISNTNISYELIDGLHLKASIGYNDMTLHESTIKPITASNPVGFPGPESRINDQSRNDLSTWTFDPQLDYSKHFRNHSIDALFGATWQQSIQDGLHQRFSGFSSDDLIENLSAATSISSVISNYSKYKYNAFYGRIGYNFKEKYVLNLTGRRDGSSRFGPNNQFGNFGAIGAAWIITKEDFLKLPSFISFAKLRGSIGKTGNDKLLDYEFLSSYLSSGYSYLGVSTLYPKSLTNPDYGWETINKMEGGLETSFLNSRINLNINWYRNRTTNQLVGYNLPGITGFTTIRANLPAVIQNKGLEIEVSSINLKTEKLFWSTSANLSLPKSKLVSYPNIESSSYAQSYVVGQPLSLWFLYKYTGIDAKTGLYTFEDLNNDGSITSEKDRVPIFVGQKWFGSINNSVTYKQISIDFTFQFVKQTGLIQTIENGLPGIANANQRTELLNRWQSASNQPIFQKYTSSFGNVNVSNNLYNQSNALICDASFIRLKNVYLSWQLPKLWQEKLKTSNLKLFVQGQNLLTITKYKGLDPETQSINPVATLPSLRIVTTGLNLTF